MAAFVHLIFILSRSCSTPWCSSTRSHRDPTTIGHVRGNNGFVHSVAHQLFSGGEAWKHFQIHLKAEQGPLFPVCEGGYGSLLWTSWEQTNDEWDADVHQCYKLHALPAIKWKAKAARPEGMGAEGVLPPLTPAHPCSHLTLSYRAKEHVLLLQDSC